MLPFLNRKRRFLARLFSLGSDAIFLAGKFAGEEVAMTDWIASRVRYGESFWRAHHEAWRRGLRLIRL